MYSKAPLTIEEMTEVKFVVKTLRFAVAARGKMSKSLAQETEQVLSTLEYAIENAAHGRRMR